jgi:hypothetical protein
VDLFNLVDLNVPSPQASPRPCLISGDRTGTNWSRTEVGFQ